MKVKYLGPSKSVNVAPYGAHPKGVTIEYSDEFAEDLLETSTRQRFEEVEQLDNFKDWTVRELKAALVKKGVEFPENTKKAGLVALMEKASADAPEE